MNKENKTILLNQLRIMSAMQRLEYFVHQQEIKDDLSEGIKDTQKTLDNDMDNEISIKQENTNYKQALIDIREYIKNKQKIQYKFALSHIECDDILQITDKILGDSDER